MSADSSKFLFFPFSFSFCCCCVVFINIRFAYLDATIKLVK